jgi:hypothetical protein
MQANVVSLIVGARGTGKTDFVKNDVIVPSPLPKKLIVDTFDSDVWHTLETYLHPEQSKMRVPIIDPELLDRWKKGTYRIASGDVDNVFFHIEANLRNALIVFEDATKYIGSTLTKEFKKFLYDSKQKNLNIALLFHSLVAIPPELVRAADTLTLFKTNEGYPNKTKYPFPDIPKAMDFVRNSENHFENITIRLN